MENKASHKQAFYFTIINYLGILIGIVSTLFIYPKNKEMLGIFRYVEALSQILFPILLLGASHALINFHPKLNQHHKKQLFNYSIVSVFIMSGIVFSMLFFGSYFSLLANMKFIYFAMPIAFCLALIELFKKQATIIQKIAIPTFLDNIIPKIALPILFLLLLNDCISENKSLLFYAFSYGLILLLLTLYLFFHYKPKFNLNFDSLFIDVPRKEYYKYSLYAFAGSLGSLFAFRIDSLMIPKLVSMQANGTFSIGVTLASALAVPATGIFTLYAPIISNYIKENNFKALDLKYKEVSKLLFFIGALLYSCIFLGINNLFLLLPTHDALIDSIPVILILGFNVLVNMGTGFNGEIITYSKYYKFNIIAIFVLIVLNVSLNVFFVKVLHLGIEGFAYASLIAMVLFNLSKLLFIYHKFKILPFDKSYLKLVIITTSILVLISVLPEFSLIWVNLIYKLTLCLSVNLWTIYRLKLVYSFNFWTDKIFNTYKQRH